MGDDVQTYTFCEIEDIIETTIPPSYINRKAFKLVNVSRFQMSAISVGFLLTDADYVNQTLTFTKNNGSIIAPTRTNTRLRATRIRSGSSVSSQALDPNDLGEDLVKAVNHFKNNWKTTNGYKYLALRNKYHSLADVYYNAASKAYSPSVNNRVPLFEGMTNRNRIILREESVQYLAEKLAELFKIANLDFNKFSTWEYQVATYIRKMYHSGGVRLYTYGNAQKLINMAIKYCLSSNIVDYKYDVFKHCFIPIDARIQSILKKQLRVDYLHNKGAICSIKPSWALCDDWGDILDYQIRARDAILHYGYYSPLIWEVTHWN